MTTPARPPIARKPAAPPTPADLAERDRWAALVASSLDRVRASAQTWRTGLTAFLTLVTAGAVLKGRDTTADLADPWRTAITVAIGGGLLLAVIGLWQALAAEAGTHPRPTTLQAIRAKYGTLAGYEVHLAGHAARRLSWAKFAVALAVPLLLAGLSLTWWAPQPLPTPPAQLSVDHAGTTTCGQLISADEGQLRLMIAGTHNPAVILLSSITNIAVVTHCP